METLSALLALCVGNHSLTKEQGPVLLTFLRHVARILANGSAAFFESCDAIGWNSYDVSQKTLVIQGPAMQSYKMFVILFGSGFNVLIFSFFDFNYRLMSGNPGCVGNFICSFKIFIGVNCMGLYACNTMPAISYITMRDIHVHCSIADRLVDH